MSRSYIVVTAEGRSDALRYFADAIRVAAAAVEGQGVEKVAMVLACSGDLRDVVAVYKTGPQGLPVAASV